MDRAGIDTFIYISTDDWRRRDDRVCCAQYIRVEVYAYNVYALLYYTYMYDMRNTYKHVYPAGSAAAAASTAGIGAVSHSRHVLLVIFVLFNKKTIKSRHIYRGTTSVGIVQPARRARQNNRIIIFPCRYIMRKHTSI